MFKMEVPYDKKNNAKISLEDKNLAGVLVGRQSDYVSDKSEKEIVEESLDACHWFTDIRGTCKR